MNVPKTVSVLLTKWYEDTTDNDLKQKIFPFLQIVQTKSSADLEMKRSILVLDWFMRSFIPAWYEGFLKSEVSRDFKNLPQIESPKHLQMLIHQYRPQQTKADKDWNNNRKLLDEIIALYPIGRANKVIEAASNEARRLSAESGWHAARLSVLTGYSQVSILWDRIRSIMISSARFTIWKTGLEAGKSSSDDNAAIVESQKSISSLLSDLVLTSKVALWETIEAMMMVK